MHRKAFTLVELLVVVAIIGLLSTIAMVSLNQSRINSRNIKRVGDIRQLATTFALIYNNGVSFDTSGYLAGWTCVSTACTGDRNFIPADATVDAAIAPYIIKPTDPTSGNRAGGGYGFAAPWPGGVSLYDGFVFPSGVYLSYTLETSTAACPLGRKWDGSNNTTYCAYKLEN